MLSFILVVCIIGFNIKKIYTFPTEDALYAFEIVDERKYRNNENNEANKETKIHFTNNLDLMSLLPQQLLDINKIADVNVNIFEFPADISMKPCKY